ncbi:SRPBCC domain-containing protein [Hoeflea sp. G2-23]|uniref:SRPBCC domain-containing protein n=1 Tax=Hoeflea algicola TaxID=2983763 RepID=A0ABT3Z877_9HYPH|nr:SRPBCC domain-containing protein [Hoeflea algicola]MCY0147962.1 SRPBCC domain-containing protein [Hoeflea algicola]
MTDSIEILNDRLFPVDRATLFDAFADPCKLEQWWGPEGFTNTISAFDLRPGGSWLVTMTADNGANFHNRWTFEEIVAGKMVRMTHHEPVHIFTLGMRFSDEEHGTRLLWRMLFDRTEENEVMEKFLHAANEQNFDRLARLLKQDKGDH